MPTTCKYQFGTYILYNLFSNILHLVHCYFDVDKLLLTMIFYIDILIQIVQHIEFEDRL